MEDVIATQGTSRFLIQTAKDKGRILDLDQQDYFPEFNIHSLIARGYWEAFEGDPQPILEQAHKLDKGGDWYSGRRKTQESKNRQENA